LICPDLQEIHTLELPKLPNESDMTELFDWLSLIKAQKGEEYEMIAKSKGFSYVASAPLVRSSYHADKALSI